MDESHGQDRVVVNDELVGVLEHRNGVSGLDLRDLELALEEHSTVAGVRYLDAEDTAHVRSLCEFRIIPAGKDLNRLGR